MEQDGPGSRTISVLTEQQPGIVWSCVAVELSCTPVTAPVYDGLVLAQLVARRGAA